MTPCVIYAAKSTTDEHGSIPSQLDRCHEHAERNGWQVDREYRDEAASAYKGSRGPGLKAARARAAELAAEHGEAVLLVFASDRLARGDGRSAAHLLEYVLEAYKGGYRIESVTEDLGGQMALVHAALFGERAHADSHAKSEHTKRGKRRAAESGRRNGGPRPFGYQHLHVVVDGKPRSRLEVVPAEARVLRRMFQAAAEGRSQSDTARELNAAGVKPVRGGSWSQSTVGQMLRNRLYIGDVRHGADHFPGQHDAIIGRELWDAAERARVRARRSGGGGGRPTNGSHLLTGGLLRCECGASMRARSQQKQYGRWEAYLCGGRQSGRTRCTMPALPREDIDRAVWRYFETVGLDVDAMRREADELRSLRLAELRERVAEADRELATVTEQLERIRGDYRAGKLDVSDWREFRDELGAEISAATAALEQLRTNEADVAQEASLRDAEEETLAALAAIRQALAGAVTGATDLGSARLALRRLFESFTLHRYGETTADIIDADLAAGDWYIVPEVRADAILWPLLIGPDTDGEPSVAQGMELRRTAIPSGGKPRDSSR